LTSFYQRHPEKWNSYWDYIPADLPQPSDQNFPGENWWDAFFWINPRESGSEEAYRKPPGDVIFKILTCNQYQNKVQKFVIFWYDAW